MTIAYFVWLFETFWDILRLLGLGGLFDLKICSMMTLKVTVTLDEDVIVTFEFTLTKSIRSPRTVFKLLGLFVNSRGQKYVILDLLD